MRFEAQAYEERLVSKLCFLSSGARAYLIIQYSVYVTIFYENSILQLRLPVKDHNIPTTNDKTILCN